MASTKRPMIRIHNSESNQVIDRDMNDEEFTQYEADVAKFEADKIAKAEAQTAREAILQKLGLTADEAALLLK